MLVDADRLGDELTDRPRPGGSGGGSSRRPVDSLRLPPRAIARNGSFVPAMSVAVLGEMDLAIDRGYGGGDSAAVIEAIRPGRA